MKKLLSLVLTVAILLSMLCIPALAADNATLSVTGDTNGEIKAGDTITATVTVPKPTSQVASGKIRVEFKNSVLTATSIKGTGGIQNFEIAMITPVANANTNSWYAASLSSTNNTTIDSDLVLTAVFTVKDAVAGNYSDLIKVDTSTANYFFADENDADVVPAAFSTSTYNVKLVSSISGEQAISITAPVKGATPQSTIAEGTGYTGAISWSPAVSGSFAGDTAYTATVELTAKSGYQFASTATASVSGATISEKAVESDGSKLKFKAAFPATAGKETPTCVAPSGVTATYGQTLSDLTLSNTSGNTPGAWSWMNGTQSVGNVGSNTHKAKFTPTDTANFLTVENIDVTVTVSAKNLTDVAIDNIDDQAYTGSPITPTVTVKGDSGKTLVKDTDYTVGYSNNTNKGTATVTVKAKSGGNYTFTDVTKDFTIVAAASSISITGDPSKTYDGAAVTDPAVNKTGSAGAVTYAYYKNADCTTQTGTADGAASNGAAPKNAGSYWVKASVAADANYGSATSEAKAFTISPKNASGLTIELPATLPTFTGSEQTITVTVKDSGTTLALDKDYTVSGNSATNVGNTTLTVTGKGNYTGTATTTWSLQKATPVVGDFSITAPGLKPYTGSPISVTAPTSSKNGIGTQRTVYYEGTSGTSYTKSTTAPTNVGTYTVTFDVNAGSNYNAASDLVLGTLTITKADYSGNKTFTTTVRSGQVNSGVTVTLPALPAGASYGTITVGGTGSTLIDGTPTASGTTLTFNTTNQTDGTEATITIPVTGATNYNDYSLTVTVTAKDKENAGVSIADATKTTTYGTNVTISATATATGGEWSWTFPSDTFEAVGATNSASITLKPLKATDSAATVTAKYESETHIGEATASATVGKKNVTITGLSAQNKVYDGNRAATVTGTAVINGKVGSDDVTVTTGSAAFADKNVGSGKTVTFTGYTLGGAKAGNYNLTDQPASVTANITAKPVTVTVTATNRDYVSGNKSVALTGGTIAGMVIRIPPSTASSICIRVTAAAARRSPTAAR